MGKFSNFPLTSLDAESMEHIPLDVEQWLIQDAQVVDIFNKINQDLMNQIAVKCLLESSIKSDDKLIERQCKYHEMINMQF